MSSGVSISQNETAGGSSSSTNSGQNQNQSPNINSPGSQKVELAQEYKSWSSWWNWIKLTPNSNKSGKGSWKKWQWHEYDDDYDDLDLDDSGWGWVLDQDMPVAIIDNGSGMTKVGLSTHDKPVSIFPSQVGIPRKRHRKRCDRDFYCGEEVPSNRDKLTVSHPIEQGVIENFQHIEMLWDYWFVDVLKIDPESYPVLLTEPPYNPKPNRERMVELMFEWFGVPSLNISIQGILALLGQGRTTGLVLDCGAGVTHVIPVYDGFGLPHSFMKMDIAGQELNVYLAKLLARAGISMSSTEQQWQVEKMKEQLCYVSMNPDTEVVTEPSVYQLPDGQEVSLYDEAWRCPEALFTPSVVGLDEGTGGVAGLIMQAVNKCSIDVRKSLLQNIVLSGGSTMFRNFDTRLTQDLARICPTNMHARVVTQAQDKNDRRHSVWQGAQVYANLRSMQQDSWITAAEYDEYGPGYIHDKIAVKYN